MPKDKRQRADQLAFEQGLAESREQARRLIMAGQIVLSPTGPDGEPLLPPGAPPQRRNASPSERDRPCEASFAVTAPIRLLPP